MFNRYWREYPWMFQFLQFIILLFVLFSFFSLAIIPLVVKGLNIPLEQAINISATSSRKVVLAALFLQIIQAIGIFLLPSLMFAYFTHPRPKQYLGLRKPGKPVQWAWVITSIIGAIPVLMAIQSLVSNIKLPDSVVAGEEARHQTIEAFLNVRSLPEFLLTFFTLAVLPGLSEELFFRGIMMRMAAKSSRKTVFAIILTALVFALFHFDYHGFLSIFLAGILLGYIYYLTGSLWLSIVAHMIHNGLQVLLFYFFKDDAAIKNMIENEVLPWYLPAIGLVIFVGSFYMLWKNRTPLPANWTDDFNEEEIKAMIEEEEEQSL
jgi:uncharacterized protein